MAKKAQIDKFRETARALETDEDEAKFDVALRAVAKHKPEGGALLDKPKKPTSRGRKKSE